jgi:hypothetical protein
MASGVFGVADSSRKKMNFGLAFGRDKLLVGQRPVFRVEGFSHQGYADKIIRIFRALFVGGISRCNLDLFQCLKNSDVVVPTQIHWVDFVRQRRLQQADRQHAAGLSGSPSSFRSGSLLLPLALRNSSASLRNRLPRRDGYRL